VTYDPTAAYRTAQVTTSSPVAQVVLLYEGAIRFTSQSVVRLEASDPQGAHQASIRAQAIVSALRESLDLSAGEMAGRLDNLYDFMLRRLVAGNLAKDPAPAREVIGLLRELLDAWRAVAASARPSAPAPTSLPVGSRAATSVGLAYRSGLPGAA
jgi:flagellar protein FliS